MKDSKKYNSDGTIKPQFLVTSKRYKTDTRRTNNNDDTFINEDYLNDLYPISNPASRYCNDERITDPYIEQGSNRTPTFISYIIILYNIYVDLMNMNNIAQITKIDKGIISIIHIMSSKKK